MGLLCLVSAKQAGDPYPVRTSMVFDGFGTCLAALFGSPFGTCLYIGHPAYKRNGAKNGYSLMNGLIYFVLSWFGVLALIQSIFNWVMNTSGRSAMASDDGSYNINNLGDLWNGLLAFAQGDLLISLLWTSILVGHGPQMVGCITLGIHCIDLCCIWCHPPICGRIQSMENSHF